MDVKLDEHVALGVAINVETVTDGHDANVLNVSSLHALGNRHLQVRGVAVHG